MGVYQRFGPGNINRMLAQVPPGKWTKTCRENGLNADLLSMAKYEDLLESDGLLQAFC